MMGVPAPLTAIDRQIEELSSLDIRQRHLRSCSGVCSSFFLISAFLCCDSNSFRSGNLTKHHGHSKKQRGKLGASSC